MTTVFQTMTIEEFATYAASHGRCELIRGKPYDLPFFGERHGYITSRVSLVLCKRVYQQELGNVYATGTGFRLDDEGMPTVRAPDIAFIAAARTAAASNKSFCTIVPDLVVETLFPDDRVGEVSAKIHWWLGHGVRAVWVVDPEERTVVVHAREKQPRLLNASDTLTGDDILPGFTCVIADIFA